MNIWKLYLLLEWKSNIYKNENFTLLKKCRYSELLWSAFSRIRTEYGEIRSISPYSVRMRENVDQSNSEYGHYLRSVKPYKNGPHLSKKNIKYKIKLCVSFCGKTCKTTTEEIIFVNRHFISSACMFTRKRSTR